MSRTKPKKATKQSKGVILGKPSTFRSHCFQWENGAEHMLHCSLKSINHFFHSCWAHSKHNLDRDSLCSAHIPEDDYRQWGKQLQPSLMSGSVMSGHLGHALPPSSLALPPILSLIQGAGREKHNIPIGGGGGDTAASYCGWLQQGNMTQITLRTTKGALTLKTLYPEKLVL